MKFVGLCTIISLLIAGAYSKNILFFWGVSGYSHRISAWPLIEKLAEKGHSITFISPYASKMPSTHPNITDIVPKNLDRDVGLMFIDFISIRLQKGVQAVDDLWYEYYDSGIRGCESLMRNKEVIQWVKESHFDLVILDALHNECGYGLVWKFKSPYIMYTPTSHFAWFKDAYGYPDENLPEMQYHYPIHMTFFQSVHNLLSSLYWQWKRQTELFPKLEPLLKSALNLPDLPPLDEIERNTSLILTNLHPSEEFPRSLPPNVIDIGGIHCNDDRKPLPKDLEDFIASGSEGFILVSFGTYTTLSNLPEYLQRVIFSALGAVPHFQFLVKYDDNPPSWMQKVNVKKIDWVSQQDIIAHPKIKAFIGHGGLLSTQEAIFHGVPMIVIPLFAEQDYQAVRARQRETAIALEITELTEEKLTRAIVEVTRNPKYKANTMKISKLFRDRQNQPLESAVWWIEYIMRHKDVSHLRPVGINKTWYERRMLHIWGFILLCIVVSAGIAIYFLAIVIKMLRISKIKHD